MHHFRAKSPSVGTCDPQHFDYYKRARIAFFVVRSNAVHKSSLRALYPAPFKLAELHRALSEVLCEHKSRLVKRKKKNFPHGENDLNKHSPKIIPSLGSSNLPQNGARGRGGGGITERIPEDVMAAEWRSAAIFVAVFVPSALKQRDRLRFSKDHGMTSDSGGVGASLNRLSHAVSRSNNSQQRPRTTITAVRVNLTI